MSNPVIDEFMALLEELKNIVDNNGGKLPNPKENPDFYAKLQAFIDFANEEGIKITLKEVAERLNVPYATLRTYLTKYRKSETRDELPEPSKPLEEPVDVEVTPTIPPALMGVEEKPEKKTPAKSTKKENPKSPVTLRTEMRIAESAKRHLGKKAEVLTKEEVEKLIGIGKHIRENYEKLCYNQGYDDVMTCIDDAFTSLFDITPEYEFLKERYEVLKTITKELIKLLDPMFQKLFIIEVASNILNPEDILELVDSMEGDEVAFV